LLLRRQSPYDRQTACQQPLTSDHPAKFADEERVRFNFNVIGNEARSRFRCDLARDRNGPRMIRVVRIEQGQNGA